MSFTENTIYPTDILRSKYKPLLEASIMCNCTVKDIIEAIKSKELRYAEFRIEGSHRRVPHVNPEDLQKYLDRRKTRDDS